MSIAADVAVWQGTILIAVNPLRRVPSPDMSDFVDHALNPEEPHPFAIAEVRACLPVPLDGCKREAVERFTGFGRQGWARDGIECPSRHG